MGKFQVRISKPLIKNDMLSNKHCCDNINTNIQKTNRIRVKNYNPQHAQVLYK